MAFKRVLSRTADYHPRLPRSSRLREGTDAFTGPGQKHRRKTLVFSRFIGLSHPYFGRTLVSTTLASPRYFLPRFSPSLSLLFLPSSPPVSHPLRKGVHMNLTISGHHLDVTPALREYVLTKMDRITRHFDQVVDINVLLSVEKLKEKERRQKAEVTLHVKGKDIFVEQSHEDLYAAIDQLMDKLDRQVCRHKDKVQDHHHVAPKRMDATA
jgi:putative sigma-54 modulation protein